MFRLINQLVVFNCKMSENSVKKKNLYNFQGPKCSVLYILMTVYIVLKQRKTADPHILEAGV